MFQNSDAIFHRPPNICTCRNGREYREAFGVGFAWLDVEEEEVALDGSQGWPDEKGQRPGQSLAVHKPRERSVVNGVPEKDGRHDNSLQVPEAHFREGKVRTTLDKKHQQRCDHTSNDQMVQHRRIGCSGSDCWCHRFNVIPLQHENEMNRADKSPQNCMAAALRSSVEPRSAVRPVTEYGKTTYGRDGRWHMSPGLHTRFGEAADVDDYRGKKQGRPTRD